MGGLEAGVFSYSSRNLGDEMQSFAVLAHLDRVDRFVDRDHLADVTSAGGVSCVFNSWFLLGDDLRPPSDDVMPVWYGFCAGRPEVVAGGDWLRYLRRQHTVGCRDLFTTDLLGRMGIDAFWSGCLTLFLRDALGTPAQRARDGVLFLDVPVEVERWIPPRIVRRAERLSTFPPPSIVDRPLERLASVARIVDRLACAELVVTRRLHVAAPAASFGTPVLAIPDPRISEARRRFSGFTSIVPTVFLDQAETALRRIAWDDIAPARIPSELKLRRDVLHASLASSDMRTTEPPQSPLDDLRRRTQHVVNAAGLVRPGRIRLGLADRSFELGVRCWSDRQIEVGLSGFPGLSKFAFEVEVSEGDREAWTSWGPLRDLTIGGDGRHVDA